MIFNTRVRADPTLKNVKGGRARGERRGVQGGEHAQGAWQLACLRRYPSLLALSRGAGSMSLC